MVMVCIIPLLGILKCEAGQIFNRKYSQEALDKTMLPEIIPSRPRLLLRAEPWAHGPDLKSLRAWSVEAPLSGFLKNRPWDPKPRFEWAFRYLLTGDEKFVGPIVERMKAKNDYWPGALYRLAVLYDWTFNSPEFSEQDKRIVENKIVKWAEQAVSYGQKYHDMWSHFGYRPVLDIAAAGLALHGRRKEAIQYLAMSRGYMEKTFFPGWRANDGAWQGGWDYYRQGAANLFKLIGIWSSATSEDLYEKIESNGGDWIRGHMAYLMYTMYPDLSPMESAGFGYTPNQKGGTSTLFLLARAYKDKKAAEHLRWRDKDKGGWRLGISQYLYYFPSLRHGKAEQLPLPLTRLFGKEGLGYVQMRSGKASGDTIVEFKCGDYFWSHQSMSQNAFTIYRKGRLAIQSGIYSGGYWGDHMLNYYRPTIGSNSILVIQPQEITWVPPRHAGQDGVPNIKGYIKEFGGQRSCYIHPDFGSAETCFTWKKYLYRKTHDHYFETGDMKAYEAADRYAYAMGDATMAYNNPGAVFKGNTPKLDLFTRQMVFLDKKYLVMFDRVRSLDPSYEKRWLMHSVGEPRMDGNLLHSEVPYHLETYSAGTVVIENGEGRLFCRTLFPEKFKIRKIGGGAQITAVKPGIANSGNTSLKGITTGIFKKVSPSIATEQAISEDWKISFTDSETFTIQGSVTGNDGKGSLSGKKSRVFISDSGRIFIPKKQWQGTPGPGDTFSFSVLSPSYRFWVGGKNHPPPNVKKLVQQFQEGAPLDPGNWRIEVIPENRRKYDFFLHFLYPCDRDPSGIVPDVKEVMSSNDVFKGLAVRDWVLMFQNRSSFIGNTNYKVDSGGKIQNLILGLDSGKEYKIKIKQMAGRTGEQSIKASENGTLTFTTKGNCEVYIKL